MTDTTIAAYVRWITPSVGDPTYSLLRAHLLFERLIDSSLERSLPHPSALRDARLSFAQKLAIARAANAQSPHTHWTWQAVAKLNKIRNHLAHSPDEALAKEVAAYVEFCKKHGNLNLPKPDGKLRAGAATPAVGAFYTAADMVTLGLYIALASSLGFDVEKFASSERASAA